MNWGEVGSREDEMNKRRRDGDAKWSKEGVTDEGRDWNRVEDGEMRDARGRNWRMKTRKEGSEGQKTRVFTNVCWSSDDRMEDKKSTAMLEAHANISMQIYWEQADFDV